ncbi:MAG TPA: flagellar export protein FliJ [Candidatus Deferrimicrobium sp.]|nr:flagellar export protein FliJ [Candidatus Kapabacteria bacterium]HLP61154.1 flagellar export protein FliJ [Candidatus Deferrimicrobium sp.]
MKRFVFKLDNVLKYRETLENLAKNAYSEALRLFHIEKNKLVALETKRDHLKAAYDVKAGSVTMPDVLSFLNNYSGQLLFLIGQQREVTSEKEKVVREKFADWNRKRRDVKIMKRLEEKKKQEYLRQVDKEEQKFQDEIFIAKTVREMVR